MMTGMFLGLVVRLQPVQDLEAGHVGQDQVEEDDIRLLGASAEQGLLSPVRFDDLEMTESGQRSLIR